MTLKERKGIRKKPTIKQISGMTGFSPATVSLVLNNKGSFAEETRDSIMKALADLGGEHAAPSEARNGGRQFVRLLIEETDALFTTDSYNSDIMMGIEQECRDAGLEIALAFVRTDSDPVQIAEGAAGLIAIGGGLITDSLVMRLQQAGKPLILVDNYTHAGNVPSVHADHYGAGFMATQRLIARGHDKIGFISGPVKYKPLVDRYAGYCAALIENGLPLRPEYVAPNVDRKFVKGYMEMKYLIELPDRPTAVFAVSDRAALGGIQALQDMGLVHGKDVELVGCDNIAAIGEVVPPIATVHVPRIEVGQMAVRFLLEAIKGNTLAGKFVLPGRWVEAERLATK